MHFLLAKRLVPRRPKLVLRFWLLASFSKLASPEAWSHPPTCYEKDLRATNLTPTKRGRQDSCARENVMTLVQIVAFIFMNGSPHFRLLQRRSAAKVLTATRLGAVRNRLQA